MTDPGFALGVICAIVLYAWIVAVLFKIITGRWL